MADEPGVRSISGRTVSTVDLVTAEIRRAVLTGALPPGEPFSIRALTQQLGVSHIPIREALRRLESQGLIVLKQSQSALVASLTTEDMEGIYGLRLQIEPALAAASVGRHTPEQIDRLHESLERSRDVDPEIAWQAHHAFHEGLVAPAASSWDLRVLDLLWTAAERYTHLVFDPTPIDDTERERRHGSHAVLLASVTDADSQRVRTDLAEHLTLNENQIRVRMDELRVAMERRTSSA